MHRLKNLKVLLPVLGLVGCNLFSSGPGVALRTDARAYVAERVGVPSSPYRQFAIVVSAQNYSRQPMFLETCSPSGTTPIDHVSLVDSDPADEGAAYGPAWACVGHDQQLELGPLQTRVDTILLTGPNSQNGITGEWRGVMEGRFRISYQVQSCRGSQCLGEWVRSNVFTVDAEP